MAWILLDGLDRTGKTSLADHFKDEGYEIVHMSAPDKKYRDEGYAGPSYLDEMIDLYMAYDGEDVVFDRTIYGESIWPSVYNRKAQLSNDDIEVLQEFENRNSPMKILMTDKNVAAHWKRCEDNKEPLSKSQFTMARNLFGKLVENYGFIRKELGEFPEVISKAENKLTQEREKLEKQGKENLDEPSVDDESSRLRDGLPSLHEGQVALSSVERLHKANAINSILSSRIVKKKGDNFDKLEEDIRGFLENELGRILGEPNSGFSTLQEQILKQYADKIIRKMNG